MFNFTWMWAGLISLILIGFLDSKLVHERWIIWILGLFPIFCVLMLILPPMKLMVEQTKNFETVCKAGGNVVIVVEDENNFKILKCVKQNYKIPAIDIREYCNIHGGTYMKANDEWVCIDKKSWINIEIN